MYHVGDTVDAYAATAGFLTTSNTEIIFQIPLSRPIDAIVTSGTAIIVDSVLIRGNGNYLVNTDISVTVVTLKAGVILKLTREAGFGGTNNSVVAVQGDIRLVFS